jgi:Cytochrome c554 and c-prime
MAVVGRNLTVRAALRVGPLGRVIVIVAVVGLGVSCIRSGIAAENDAESAPCLGCHGSAGMEKKLENGETLFLYIPADEFSHSVHNGLGCTGCHADIKLDSHPPSEKKISSKRAYAVQSAEVCSNCHQEQFAQWETSTHGALVRNADPAAPVCTGCHLTHSIRPAATLATLDTVPCKNCHQAVFEAYAGSVHGLARRSGNAAAPICSGCHGAHEVNAADLAGGLKNSCLGCHSDALDVHAEWLRNAGLHFDAVSCSACHVPGARRKVDLRLYDSTGQQVSEQTGVPVLEARIRSEDPQSQGLNAVTLWRLLQTLNREGTGKTVLHGRLEVSSGVEAHKLANKSRAVSDCATCHREGADAFQSVTITIAGPDGRPLRYGASKDVLSSPISIESVGGFYAIGGTRIRLLDFVFALALLGGIAVPAGHMTAKWYFRRLLLRQAAGRSANQGPAPPPALGSDHASDSRTMS